jgi:predicted MFS family arabinose efflux permease
LTDSFRRFWIGSAISAGGSALTALAIPIVAVGQLAATPAQMGVIFAAATASSFLLRLPAAAWADRSGRPLAVVFWGQFLSGVLIAAVPALWLFSALTYESLVVIVAAMGATGAIVGAFAAPIVPHLVSKDHLATAYGRFSASRGAADAAGPALGGAILQVLAAPLLLVLDALSFIVAAFLTRTVRVVTSGGEEPASASSVAVGQDLWAIFREPFLRRCLVVIAYASLANGAANALLVLFMVRQLEQEPFAVGIALGAGAVGGMLAGIVIGRIHHDLGIGRTAAVAGVLMVVSLAGLPIAQPGWSGLAACLFYELAGSFGAVLMVITVVSEIPSRVSSKAIARAMALTNLVPEIAATAGALAGGVIASAISVRFTLWTSLAVAVVFGVLTLVMNRVGDLRGRDLPGVSHR